MRILTFGWELPPAKNGGLGVACHDLTKELIAAGVEVVFVLPRKQSVEGPFEMVFADIEPAAIYTVDAYIRPYESATSYITVVGTDGKPITFARSKLEEVYRYAEAAKKIARHERFDIIHAHDWSSYLAGLAAKLVSGKPLVLHVHATAFDQAGGDSVDPSVYAIERHSFAHADRIVAVSKRTKDMIVERYGVFPGKIEVIHNGSPFGLGRPLPPVLEELRAEGKKIVLYHGRITIQKGVDYFVRAARRVVDVDPNVMFVISGWGDMERQIMDMVGGLGLSRNVIFAGPLWDDERDRMYQSADLLVMPSVSEPFGLVPLESLRHGTPVLISKQSGVAEVLTHALKVDFWDVDEMANKMLAAVRYRAMNKQLVVEGQQELHRLSWRHAADKIVHLYRRMLDWFMKRA